MKISLRFYTKQWAHRRLKQPRPSERVALAATWLRLPMPRALSVSIAWVVVAHPIRESLR